MVKAKNFWQACKNRFKKAPILGSRYLTSVVFGNLSQKSRDRWEAKVGQDYFDSEVAANRSLKWNFPLYGLIGAGIGYLMRKEATMTVCYIGDLCFTRDLYTTENMTLMGFCAAEGVALAGLEYLIRKTKNGIRGSLIASPVSLTLDQIAELCEDAKKIEDSDEEK